MPRPILVGLLTLTLWYGSLAPSAAQPVDPLGDRPVMVAVYVPDGLSVDGRLDESIYGEVEPTSGFIQQEPNEGAPVSERTEAWVFFDETNVYFAARLWDSQPERMVVNEMRRDGSGIGQNENFTVVIDTFDDQRTGYYFLTNPLGAIRDAEIAGEGQFNTDWNPVWDPQAERFEQGWTLEIAVPFKSIRYPAEGEQVWGIQMRRVVRWKNETSHLTPIPASLGNGGVSRLTEAVALTGIRTPRQGPRLDIKPYAITDLRTDRTAQPRLSNELGGDVGLDVKYGVTEGLTADFTVNTDFAQVEADQQQVNLTRFNLFFPEKREFFLEGQGTFSFGGGGGGGGGGGDSPVLFFSRRIGLEGGQAVPILGGGRLTGKVGRFAIGLVNIQTGKSDDAGVPSTNFGAVRVKGDVFGSSSVGFIATQRTPGSGDNNTAAGVDANLIFGQTTINSYYAKTWTPDRSGDDHSYRASYDYNQDLYGVNVEHLAVGEHFNPEVGFVRRRDFRKYATNLRYSPRPAGWAAVRKIYFEGQYDYYTNGAHRLETRDAQFQYRMEFERGDVFSASYTRSNELLEAPFTVSSRVPIPVGRYSFQHGSLSFQPPAQSPVRGTFSLRVGGFFNGDLTEARYSGRLDVTPQLTVEPTIAANWIDLPGGSFRTDLLSTRTTYSFSPRTLVAALIQYNSSNNTLSSNLRFRWEYIPGSDLFVVYSDGRDTDVTDRFAELQNRTFVVKLTRMFRF